MDWLILTIVAFIIFVIPTLVCGYGAFSEFNDGVPTYAELWRRIGNRRAKKKAAKAKGYTKRELNQSALDDWQEQYDRLLGIKPVRSHPKPLSQGEYFYEVHKKLMENNTVIERLHCEAEQVKKVAMQNKALKYQAESWRI